MGQRDISPTRCGEGGSTACSERLLSAQQDNNSSPLSFTSYPAQSLSSCRNRIPCTRLQTHTNTHSQEKERQPNQKEGIGSVYLRWRRRHNSCSGGNPMRMQLVKREPIDTVHGSEQGGTGPSRPCQGRLWFSLGAFDLESWKP
jgi:hypothetical protein